MELKQKEILKNEYDKKELDIYNRLKQNQMSITIVDASQKVNLSIICNKNDLFVTIEEKLYERYPEYKNIEKFFLANGKTINRFRTLEENGIKDNDSILLYLLG
jgi:hypothetical protein